jgi:hypothetical protein
MDLEQRVEKLERENRRLKLAGGAVVAVLLAVGLVGAVMPQEIPEVIEARQFRVIDANGTERVLMIAEGIGYYDENGKERSQMHAEGIAYYDENGENRGRMTAEGIGYFDENGQNRSQMHAGGISYFDENGNGRAQLGRAKIVAPSTGAETTYPAAVILYDAEGKVIWQAPQ